MIGLYLQKFFHDPACTLLGGGWIREGSLHGGEEELEVGGVHGG
jgi:hypothetical protein